MTSDSQFFHTQKDTFPQSSRFVEAAKCPELITPAWTDKKKKQNMKSLSLFFLTSLMSQSINYKHHILPLSSHYIVMFEEAQHPQLSEDPLAGHQVLEDIRHLLQSHLSTITGISNWPVRDGQSQFRHICFKESYFPVRACLVTHFSRLGHLIMKIC